MEKGLENVEYTCNLLTLIGVNAMILAIPSRLGYKGLKYLYIIYKDRIENKTVVKVPSLSGSQNVFLYDSYQLGEQVEHVISVLAIIISTVQFPSVETNLDIRVEQQDQRAIVDHILHHQLLQQLSFSRAELAGIKLKY